MNKNIIITLLFGAATWVACSNEELDTPHFDVVTDALEYNAGDTVTFRLLGNPDILTFYSGTPGNDYDYRDRTTMEGNKLQVRFTSLGQRDEGDISLLVSTNFSGKVDVNSVESATWTDITNRAVFSTGVDHTPSGTIDLSEFSDTGNPVNLAFRYTSHVIKSPNSRWVIRSINFERVDVDGNVAAIAAMSTAGWVAVSFKNPAANWVITTAQLLMDGGRTELDDDWVISKGFDVSSVTPDPGIALKNIATTLDSYQYRYTTPGEYKVVFVAKNQYGGKSKEVIKELLLTIK